MLILCWSRLAIRDEIRDPNDAKSFSYICIFHRTRQIYANVENCLIRVYRFDSFRRNWISQWTNYTKVMATIYRLHVTESEYVSISAVYLLILRSSYIFSLVLPFFFLLLLHITTQNLRSKRSTFSSYSYNIYKYVSQ